MKQVDKKTRLITDEHRAYKTVGKEFNGSYHHVSPEHLHRYLAEFDFRYNRRDTSDSERTDALLANAEGKRLTYRRPAA